MNLLIRSPKVAAAVDAPCRACGGENAKTVYEYRYDGGLSRILQCTACGHLFLWPVPLVSLDERVMDSIGDAELFGNAAFKFLHKYLILKREIRNVRNFIDAKELRLLDIGCGTGWTTAVWRDNGFKVTGLEPSMQRSKMAWEIYGLEVVSRHIEGFKADAMFDVVIMRHVLEHIENPGAILAKVKSFLKPEGLLVIIVPNIDCIGRHVFMENWEWVLPWHLHFFTPQTLTCLLSKCGFEKLRLYQTPSPLWYSQSLGRALGKSSAGGRLFEFLAAVVYVPVILAGMLVNKSNNITLICRKKDQ